MCSEYDTQSALQCDAMIRETYPGGVRTSGNTWLFSPIFAALADEAAAAVTANRTAWAKQDEEKRREKEAQQLRDRRREFPRCVEACLKAAGWNTRDHCEAVCR
jgi:hypothetical protein